MSNVSLYTLVGDYKRLEDSLEDYIDAIEAGDMDEDALWDTLDSLNGDIKEKSDSIVQLLRNKELLAASMDAEIKRLTARKKAVTNAVERLRYYLCENLSILGIDKLETTHARISFRSSEVCEMRDPDMVAAWALANGRADLLTIHEPEASKAAVKDALKAGDKIPGAILVKNRNLPIK